MLRKRFASITIDMYYRSVISCRFVRSFVAPAPRASSPKAFFSFTVQINDYLCAISLEFKMHLNFTCLGPRMFFQLSKSVVFSVFSYSSISESAVSAW